MDARAGEMFDFAVPMIETLLAGQRPDYGVLTCGWLPLDVDTFAMDNGGTFTLCAIAPVGSIRRCA